ncbi:hypothetical protein SASPL_115495 [Salvia splendens]|uniref:Serine-threonine/tyrosine-protein kinase catalytic domain-containing protein n=1 Tax=Salvia splendens TaxID=180675 RepID=A0A8X8Y8G2_SALSN|nr:hypothetical protein SASPL_115495 [Salvia splendens]
MDPNAQTAFMAMANALNDYEISDMGPTSSFEEEIASGSQTKGKGKHNVKANVMGGKNDSIRGSKMVARCFVDVSEDPIIGFGQSVRTFWVRIAKRRSPGGGDEKLVFVDDGGSRPEPGLDDLLRASAEGLGKGSYKALTESGEAVVVKRLVDLKPLSSEEFVREVRGIAAIRHPNLLPLLAYYHSKGEHRLFLYRFLPHGNLFNRLHEGGGAGVRLLADVPSHGADRMVCFKTPEYQLHKRISKKSDVWSYGCLVFELLTRRIPAHSAPPGTNGVELCGWVNRAVREEWTAEIFDPEIVVNRGANQLMLRLLQLGMKCCEKLPEKRPEMEEVVEEVEKVSAAVDSSSLTDDSSSLTDDSSYSVKTF